jgi:hypothetical protein
MLASGMSPRGHGHRAMALALRPHTSAGARSSLGGLERLPLPAAAGTRVAKYRLLKLSLVEATSRSGRSFRAACISDDARSESRLKRMEWQMSGSNDCSDEPEFVRHGARGSPTAAVATWGGIERSCSSVEGIGLLRVPTSPLVIG